MAAVVTGAEVERLEAQLDRGEQLIMVGEAVFKSQQRVRRGLVALGDQRMLR